MAGYPRSVNTKDRAFRPGLPRGDALLTSSSLHLRVRQGYLKMAAAQPERWVVVDATQPLEVVQGELQRAVLERLQDRSTTDEYG